MTRIAITGGHGFLGWHTACRLRAVHGVDAVRLGRAELADAERLAAALAGVDAVLHLAGVNRAETEREVEEGNLASAACSPRRSAGSSVPSTSSTPTRSRPISTIPTAAARPVPPPSWPTPRRRLGGEFADVLLPNLFGEHGRPAYNSFVATFAHDVAAGRDPTVIGDRPSPCCTRRTPRTRSSARSAAPSAGCSRGSSAGSARCWTCCARRTSSTPRAARSRRCRTLRGRPLQHLPGCCRSRSMWPLSPTVHADDRGELFETVRAHGGTGQAFVSTTRPGQLAATTTTCTRSSASSWSRGEAEISLRRLLHDDVVTFRLSGDRPRSSTCRPCGCTTSATWATASWSPCSGPTSCSTTRTPTSTPRR